MFWIATSSVVGVDLNLDGLNELQEKLENLEKSQEVSTDVLMTDDFIQRNSDFNNWEEFMDAGNVTSSEDIESEEFSKFIANSTQFADFEEMISQATSEYVANQLK